ncbi:hypothetical protein F5Y10DRAFT_268421 [Nemania abortiva]|nr:hypothetical protein F5Y10DRAFT_268421 [Nemania abortiva]
MWLTRESQWIATQGRHFAFGASILLVFLASCVQSVPFTPIQEQGLNLSLLPSDSGLYNGSSTHEPTKRVFVGELWLGGDPVRPTWVDRQKTGKGKRALEVFDIWCLLNGDGTNSKFTYDRLAEYGWEVTPMIDRKITEYRGHIQPLYDSDLGFKPDNEKGWGIVHSKDWGTDERISSTDGLYQNLYNGPQGYIIACNNISPAEQMKDVKDLVLPPLQKWSDVVALQWQKEAGGQQLKYVVRDLIANWDTRAAIYNALKDTGRTTLPAWPGVDFTINREGTSNFASAFWGLLGTYHAAGPAYMLAQNRDIFGHKTITKIRVWNKSVDKSVDWPISGAPEDLYKMRPNMLIFVDAV